MTQLILNIENRDVLGLIKNLIKHLNGVSIASKEEFIEEDILKNCMAEDIRAGYGEALEHLEGKTELPLAEDIVF